MFEGTSLLKWRVPLSTLNRW